jgi:GH18 family chitinase
MGFDVACDLAPSNPWADMTQDFLFTLQTTNGSSLDTAGQCVSSLNVPNWVAAVHAHNEQAFITIGGIADQDWPTACNSTNRAAFVTNLVNYMKTNGFDGIDLDIEDNAWAAQNPPVAAWDACVQAISTAAHATTTASGARPLVSEDVTTPWMGVYLTNDVSYIDQFNLMTYGESTSQVGSDVASSVAAGIPKSKSVIGVDIVDYGEPSGGCGQYGSYAQQQGLAGVMVWDIHSDAQGGSFPCFTGLGPYAG